jgi:hypothetical protein
MQKNIYKLLKLNDMKNKFKTIISFTVLILFISSCDSWIDPEINRDPGRPTTVSLNIILPTVEAGLGYAVGGDLKYASMMWMQQLAGGANQPLAYDRYNVSQGDVDNMWKWSMYAGPMKDIYEIMKKADAEKAPHYKGVAQVLMALSLGYMTDLFGDVPYSNAFQGDGALAPKYDLQKDIYEVTLPALLNSAINNLQAEKSVFSPGSDDFIYGGDLPSWIKAAYALKARFAIHLTEQKGAAAYDSALVALDNAFSSNADDLLFNFGSASSEYNPLYQFSDQRPGDIVMGKFLVDTLVGLSDPRLPLYVDVTDGAVGSAAGEGEAASYFGPFYASPNSPVIFASYVEMLFIKAEAALGTTDKATAAQAFNDAVKASLTKLGLTDTAYITANASETAGSITLQKIIFQKYLGCFLQLEIYNDWRRTGFPALTPAAKGVLGGQIARRYPYPTSERIYNSKNVPKAVPTDHVWWDKD